MVPLRVVFYSDKRTYVVKRVKITDQGIIQGPWTFSESDKVTSARNGPGMYLLDRTGKFIALSPYLIGPDGEVVGVASIPAVPQPLP
jgi:hypothetical protein